MLSPYNHLIRQTTGVSNQMAGVGNYMKAMWSVIAVSSSPTYWGRMFHEM